ncbi:MAG: hypothetical protein FJ272_14940, partial [Planctomycetes bacterium]|nr:hypothetical protein [Planctomycetota bacterium]
MRRSLVFELACAGLALLALACPAGGQDALRLWEAGKKRALLVGIERYQDPSIPPAQFADRDALALADALRAKVQLPY